MAAIKSPRISDPYLGEMYGNIIDMYDNPSYNLRLYLKPETSTAPTARAAAPPPAFDSSLDGSPEALDARNDIPDPGIVAPVPKTSKKEVTLAQTGVTGTQIDDLSIQVFQNNPATSTTCTFRIIQPGAANFLDQLQYARKYLGAPDKVLAPASFSVFIDIKFLGYTHDAENNEEGGQPIQIGDTITYELTVTKIGIRVSNSGSEYLFETTITSTLGFNDMIYKFPKNFNLNASTISEAFAQLEKQYNDHLTENSTVHDIPDTVAFNMSGLVGNNSTDPGSGSVRKFISDESLITPGTDSSMPTRSGPAYEQTENIEDTRGAAATNSTTGSSDRSLPGVIIDITEGDTIYKAVATILGYNKEFESLFTRQKDPADPGNSEVDDQKTFIYWYDIHCRVENGEWDNARNNYAKKYTYTPYLVADARSDIAFTTTEYDYLKKDPSETTDGTAGVVAIATKRLQDLYNADCLHKSYFYIFTGLNDQIINLDISFDGGITLLMPPKGGMIGDFSLTQGPVLSNQEPINKDMTLGDKLEAAKEEKNKKSLIDLFKKIKGIASSVSDLADGLGKSVTEIQAAISDTTGATAQRLADSISGAELDSLLRKSGLSDDGDPDDVPGPTTEVTQQNNGEYSPEISGFLYSSAFVQPDDSITSEEMESAGLIKLDSATPASLGHAQPDARSIKSPLGGMAVNSPAGILFGYAYRAREKTAYLLNIDMTIRGDPYWLTSKTHEVFKIKDDNESSERTIQPSGKSYYFLLTIGQPSRYDFVVDDEDANTGYWSGGRSSGMLSGLYEPTTWVNKFSGGIFTTQLTSVKEISVPLQWIRPVAPGEEPPNWDELGVNSRAITDFLADDQRATETGEDITGYASDSAAGSSSVAGPIPQQGDTVPQDERARLAAGGINIGTGPDGTVTQAEIEALGQFTGVLGPSGNTSADETQLREWADANGLRINESTNEATEPYTGYRYDRAAQVLKDAGWTVYWRDADHIDRLRVEAPVGNGG